MTRKLAGRPQVGDHLILNIDRLATGGDGVGRIEGFVLFVPMTAPGDKIEAVVTEISKNFGRARLEKIIEPSIHRAVPKCEVYGLCGGCNWQHVSYSEQLNQKYEFLRHLFPAAKVHPIVPSEPWNYRRRIQLHRTSAGVGFLKRRSHEVVTIQTCPITRKEVLDGLGRLEGELPNKFEVGIDDDLQFFVKDLSKDSPDFLQVNIEQNEKLKSIVCGLTKGSNTVLEVYGGAGNFSIAVATQNPNTQVTAIDSNRSLIELGKRRAERANLKNLNFCLANDRDVIIESGVDTILLDPPRTGCDPRLLKSLLENTPKQLVYVSCNPQTAARDFKILSEKMVLREIWPIDMFPQTDHVEMVGLLR